MKILDQKFTKNNIINLILTGLLTSCSCNKKPEKVIIYEPIEQIEDLEFAVVDPFIGDEIEFPKKDFIDRQAAAANTGNHNKRSLGKKIAAKARTILTDVDLELDSTSDDHDTSYSDLEIFKYDSGLRYQILRNGPSDAALPTRGQTVTTHYICWQNRNGEPGKLVDNSYERATPFQFKIGQGNVIRGWDEGLMDMRVGDKRRFYIPAELAWGRAGATKLVPSDTNLIYEIEIIGIK